MTISRSRPSIGTAREVELLPKHSLLHSDRLCVDSGVKAIGHHCNPLFIREAGTVAALQDFETSARRATLQIPEFRESANELLSNLAMAESAVPIR
ncbi:MAG TPA: hypothetical protein VKB91_08280, partial [Gemmatimonadaceae bacterium]|nr:hypothetical protein [Gemmatimonadaceae bacterium]